MSTSGSTDFTLVSNTIIEKAFNLLGVASEGEPLTARMYADGLLSLNLLVKTWSASEHLWLRTERSLTLVADQAAYTITPRATRVLEVRRRLTTGSIDTPLTEMSRSQYFEQANKSVSSTPNSYYYDTQGTLYLWPTPSTAVVAAQTVRLSYLRVIEDFDATNNNADLPQEWLQALIWNLANDLEVEYPVNNPRLALKIEKRAGELKDQLESWDTEPSSLYLQPEWVGQ